MKIFLAVDDSDYTIITAQPELPVRARAAVGKEVVDKYHVEEAEKILAPVSKFLLRYGIDAMSAWRVGPAGEIIAKLAKSGKFDMVVMGSVATTHGTGQLHGAGAAGSPSGLDCDSPHPPNNSGVNWAKPLKAGRAK